MSKIKGKRFDKEKIILQRKALVRRQKLCRKSWRKFYQVSGMRRRGEIRDEGFVVGADTVINAPLSTTKIELFVYSNVPMCVGHMYEPLHPVGLDNANRSCDLRETMKHICILYITREYASSRIRTTIATCAKLDYAAAYPCHPDPSDISSPICTNTSSHKL
ncbi:hypothetical protein V1477_006931 [Vespula maculifrons]|uniref:Uncharacterized protein n=1 Tax=Vespula maculifrons TaxID=7453 RepID=A0ABD2CI48_VESMC